MYSVYYRVIDAELIPGTFPEMTLFGTSYPTLIAAGEAASLTGFPYGHLVVEARTGRLVGGSAELLEFIRDGATITGSPAWRQARLAELYARVPATKFEFTVGPRRTEVVVDFVPANGQFMAHGLAGDLDRNTVTVTITVHALGATVIHNKFSGSAYISASKSVLRARFAEDFPLVCRDWEEHAKKVKIVSRNLLTELAGEMVPRMEAIAPLVAPGRWELPVSLATSALPMARVCSSLGRGLLSARLGSERFPGASALLHAVERADREGFDEELFPPGCLPDCGSEAMHIGTYLTAACLGGGLSSLGHATGNDVAKAVLAEYGCACGFFKELVRRRAAGGPAKEPFHPTRLPATAQIATEDASPGFLPACHLTVAAGDPAQLSAYLERHFPDTPAVVIGGRISPVWVNHAYAVAVGCGSDIVHSRAWKVARLADFVREYGTRRFGDAALSIVAPVYCGAEPDVDDYPIRIELPDGTTLSSADSRYGERLLDRDADAGLCVIAEVDRLADIIDKFCTLKVEVELSALLDELALLADQARRIMAVLAGDATGSPRRDEYREHAAGCVEGADFLKNLIDAGMSRHGAHHLKAAAKAALHAYRGRCLCTAARAVAYFEKIATGDLLSLVTP